MKLYLFNSLTNQNDCLIFEPQQTINFYLCGPTVYDHIHIGNLRTVIVFDVLHRFLLHCGYRVKYAHNLTDVDDKIIQKAQKEKKTEQQIACHYTRVYFQNLINYNVLQPTFTPKVTDYIPQIKEFINKLLKNNHAYQQGDNILFRVKGNQAYGQLSKQKAEKLQRNGRPGWHTECVIFIQELFKGKTIDIHGGGQDLLFPHHENERIQYLAVNSQELSKI
ncbi:17953_t:CDS:2 [Entrophospora sp. SA101]|nr:17953_t:CDS:2 [Entrophospora sp. SA101]CAJ0913737.1 12892_t:CDS:2 [Entrophospora sp. SA101]